MRAHRPSGLLEGRRALIIGGDSGIGRAVAVAFAKEGAEVVIGYLDEHEDARHTVELIEAADRRGHGIAGDHSDELACRSMVDDAGEFLGGLDLLVNNMATQAPQDSLLDISTDGGLFDLRVRTVS